MVMWIESSEYVYVSRIIHSNIILMYVETYEYQCVLLVVDIIMMDEF